jgi:outer membrane lipoprotein-sorting protein
MKILALVMLLASPAAALTGRQVIDTAQERNGFTKWHDRVMEITIDSYVTALERTRDATVSEQVTGSGEHRTFLEYTGPTDVAGTLFLHLSPRGQSDQQWLFTPSARRARRLADAARDENFMGTDLSYRDLELLVRIQQWTDAESTATLVREEPVEGTPCQLVELVPKNEEFPYARYRLWFGIADSLLLQVEVDGVEGKLFKRVKLRRYERVQDYATARESEVANVPAATRTVFTVKTVKYDGGVPDDLFSVSSVQRGR